MSEAINKNVVVMSFSIFGVPGFKTVRAEGAGAKRRMRAVVNDIDRIVKSHTQSLELNSIDAQKPYLRAERILQTILTRITHEQDYSMLQAVEDLQTVSTGQFFEIADTVYVDNYDLFMNRAREIEANMEAYLETLRPGTKKQLSEAKAAVSLSLYRLTGGVFGTKEFYFALTTRTASELGGGDAEKALRAIVFEHLRDLKNFRLSDYLRTNGEPRYRAMFKEMIEGLDVQMGNIEQITAEEVTPLTSFATIRQQGRKYNPSTAEIMQKIENDSIQRMREFFSVSRVGDGNLESDAK